MDTTDEDTWYLLTEWCWSWDLYQTWHYCCVLDQFLLWSTCVQWSCVSWSMSHLQKCAGKREETTSQTFSFRSIDNSSTGALDSFNSLSFSFYSHKTPNCHLVSRQTWWQCYKWKYDLQINKLTELNIFCVSFYLGRSVVVVVLRDVLQLLSNNNNESSCVGGGR